VAWSVFNFVYPIFGAFLLLNYLMASGLMGEVRDTVMGVTKDKRLQVVLVSFSFALFLGTVAPGGTNFAITSAMMTQAGIAALPAASVGLFGNGVQSPYGLLGLSIYSLSYVTGLAVNPLSEATAKIMFIFTLLTPL
jgi:lactate permease